MSGAYPVQPAEQKEQIASTEAREDWWDEPSLNLSAHVKWCMENKDAILALHSSTTETKIFALECIFCQRWFKHCMFSNKERKNDDPACRWCNVENLIGTDPEQFSIPLHIHCNRSGKKTCGENGITLEPPAQKKEASIEDIPPPEEQYIVKKKISQKERKVAARAAREEFGR